MGAAPADNKALVTVLVFLAGGSTVAAVGLLAGVEGLMILAGYLFIMSAIAAWYTASALMLNETYGREVWSRARARMRARCCLSRWAPANPVSFAAGRSGQFAGADGAAPFLPPLPGEVYHHRICYPSRSPGAIPSGS